MTNVSHEPIAQPPESQFGLSGEYMYELIDLLDLSERFLASKRSDFEKSEAMAGAYQHVLDLANRRDESGQPTMGLRLAAASITAAVTTNPELPPKLIEQFAQPDVLSSQEAVFLSDFIKSARDVRVGGHGPRDEATMRDMVHAMEQYVGRPATETEPAPSEGLLLGVLSAAWATTRDPHHKNEFADTLRDNFYTGR